MIQIGGNSGGDELRRHGVDTVLSDRDQDLAAYDALPPVLRCTLRKLRSDWSAVNAWQGLTALGDPEKVSRLILAEDAKNSRLWQTEEFGQVYSDVRTNDDDIDNPPKGGDYDRRAKARAHCRTQSRH